jgi:nidogen (entactin)
LKQNYEGDGYNCRAVVTCNRDPSICSINAECTWNAVAQEYQCSCRSGFYGDGKQCKQMPTNEGGDQLVVAKGMSLIKIQLKDSTPIPLTIEPFQTAIGLDFDCINQKLYWSDVASRSIKMSNINGTGKETFLDDGENFYI